MTRTRTIPGGVAALAAAAVLAALGDLTGGLAGLALLATWYALGPASAFAAGQVGVVALAGDWSLGVVGIGELAVFAVLLAPALPSARGRRFAVQTVVATVALGGVAYGAHRAWETTWATALVLVAVAALVGYGLHRYELLGTGRVDGASLD